MAKKIWQYLMIATLIFGAMGPLTSVVEADQVEVADTDTSDTEEKHEVTNDTTSETETDVSNEEETQENDKSGNLETPQVDTGKVDQTDSPKNPVVDQEATPIDETDTSEIPETEEEADPIEEPEVDTDTQEDSSIIEEDEKDQASDTDKASDVASSTDDESLEDESNSPSDVPEKDEAEVDKIQEESSSKTSDKKSRAEEFKLQAPSVVLFSDIQAPYQASVSGAPDPDLTWTLPNNLKEGLPAENSFSLNFFATVAGIDDKELVNRDPKTAGLLTQTLTVESDGKPIQQNIILGGLPALLIHEADFEDHGIYFTINAAHTLPSSTKWDYHWEARTVNPGGNTDTVTLEAYEDELTNISGSTTGSPSDSAFAIKSISTRTSNEFLDDIQSAEKTNKTMALRLVLTNDKNQTYYSNYAGIIVENSPLQENLMLTGVPWFGSDLTYTSSELLAGTHEQQMQGKLSVRDTRKNEDGNNWLLSVQATSFSNNETTIPFDYQMTTTAGNLNIVGDDVNKKTIFHGTRAEEFETDVNMTFMPRSNEITTVTKGTYKAVFTWSLAATTASPGSL